MSANLRALVACESMCGDTEKAAKALRRLGLVPLANPLSLSSTGTVRLPSWGRSA
jgi:hypothetical protein